MNGKIDIIRLNGVCLDENKNFSETIFVLKKSKHQRKCGMEKVPGITDCVSSVRYLLEQIINKTFPLGWIDEIPYLIIEQGNGKIIENLDFYKLKVFDLIFVRNKKLKNEKNRIITHMGIHLGEGKIFQDGSNITKKIITFDELFTKYNQISLLNNYNYYAKKYRSNLSGVNRKRS